MTLRQVLTLASTHIARRDAELLLAHTLEIDRTHLLAHPEDELTPAQQISFETLIQRRAAHEPLQHLTGQQEFYGLNLRVTPDTLIPRPETELLVEAVLVWATALDTTRTLRILDIGTGSGAIAIALATHLAAADITATDISPAALAVAEENASAHHCADRIHFLQSDLLEALTRERNLNAQPFDAIVSNPPYIPTTDAPTMQPEVIHHEPHTALFAGPDGLDIYRRLIPQAQAALAPNGLLALEFGFGQSEAIWQLLTGWHDIRITDDYAGIPRIAVATRR
jgi:release factor glutamine methyltransferase